MEQRQLGQSGLTVPVVDMGTWFGPEEHARVVELARSVASGA